MNLQEKLWLSARIGVISIFQGNGYVEIYNQSLARWHNSGFPTLPMTVKRWYCIGGELCCMAQWRERAFIEWSSTYTGEGWQLTPWGYELRYAIPEPRWYDMVRANASPSLHHRVQRWRLQAWARAAPPEESQQLLDYYRQAVRVCS